MASMMPWAANAYGTAERRPGAGIPDPAAAKARAQARLKARHKHVVAKDPILMLPPAMQGLARMLANTNFDIQAILEGSN